MVTVKKGPLKALVPSGQGKSLKALPAPGKIAAAVKARAKAVDRDDVMPLVAGVLVVAVVGVGIYYLWRRSQQQAQPSQVDQARALAFQRQLALPVSVAQPVPQVPVILEIR